MSSYNDIRFQVTGDLRSVANAAWISTMDQSKAEERSYEDVLRVTKFLAENAHTSPFESVTITLTLSKEGMLDYHSKLKSSSLSNFIRFGSSRDGESHFLTTDLLNFYKVNFYIGLDNEIWNEFVNSNAELANTVSLLPLSKGAALDKEEDAKSMNHDFKFSNIEVDLVSAHNHEEDSHSRFTWRVKCPLSIGVQMLRHRTGSFNMVSGRYKTIRQEFTTTSEDLIRILEKSDLLSKDKDLRERAEDTRVFYLSFMKDIFLKKKEGLIANDEYKRLREYVRFILPEGRMTELYVTFYKNDFEHFLKLRNSSHTQPEHIYIAQLMKERLEEGNV